MKLEILWSTSDPCTVFFPMMSDNMRYPSKLPINRNIICMARWSQISVMREIEPIRDPIEFLCISLVNEKGQ
jgi:hypothetical protein